MRLSKYRFNEQTGEVFKLSVEDNCYYFCGNRDGLSKKEFIRRHKWRELINQY